MSSINNVERFRERLENNQICVGTSVQVCDPLMSEVAAEAGNDFEQGIAEIYAPLPDSCFTVSPVFLGFAPSAPPRRSRRDSILEPSLYSTFALL